MSSLPAGKFSDAEEDDPLELQQLREGWLAERLAEGSRDGAGHSGVT